MKTLIYDCEIIKCIHNEWDKKPKNPNFDYCKGWEDVENMGISVIGTYNNWDKEIVLFVDDSCPRDLLSSNILPISLFQSMLDGADVLVGFNNNHFDDKLITANGFTIPENIINYDILAEAWESLGMQREFVYPTHAGYSLDRFCEVNELTRKNGSGELAPELWQSGEYKKVLNYCANDIRITTQLYHHIMKNKGWIKNPKEKTKLRTLREIVEEKNNGN